MNKPSFEKPPMNVQRSTSTHWSRASKVVAEIIPRRKPTGAVTYKLSKGANVWPGRTQIS